MSIVLLKPAANFENQSISIFFIDFDGTSTEYVHYYYAVCYW